jgi:hypothetical protein
MLMNDFEDELKKQRVRHVPEHWRGQILAAADLQGCSRFQNEPWWVILLWPSPKAWGALAAAWIVMIGFGALTRESNVTGDAPEASQIRVAMEEKRRLQAEIEEASLRLHQEPKPRSENTLGSKAV